MLTEDNGTQWDYKATLFFVRTVPANAISCFPALSEILNRSHNFHNVSSLLLAQKILPNHCWSKTILILVIKCLAWNNIKPLDLRVLPPLVQTCDKRGNPTWHTYSPLQGFSLSHPASLGIWPSSHPPLKLWAKGKPVSSSFFPSC